MLKSDDDRLEQEPLPTDRHRRVSRGERGLSGRNVCMDRHCTKVFALQTPDLPQKQLYFKKAVDFSPVFVDNSVVAFAIDLGV